MDGAVERWIGPFQLFAVWNLGEVLLFRIELEGDVLLVAELFKGQMQGDLEWNDGNINQYYDYDTTIR